MHMGFIYAYVGSWELVIYIFTLMLEFIYKIQMVQSISFNSITQQRDRPEVE